MQVLADLGVSGRNRYVIVFMKLIHRFPRPKNGARHLFQSTEKPFVVHVNLFDFNSRS
jgi:hypothetical protein